MTKNRRHLGVALLLIAGATLLHAYEHLSGATPNWLFFLWSMAPYVACALVLVLSTNGLHVVSAIAVALLMDTLMHYSVVTSDNSTAVLGYLWMPIWNLIVFVPLSMWITTVVIRRRGTENAL